MSSDAGATWTDLLDVDPPGATMGTATNSIGSVEHRIKDAASVLSVTLTQGTLASISESALFSGGNHFAYGVDGRWEIIAAQTCTLVSGSNYTLSDLLRPLRHRAVYGQPFRRRRGRPARYVVNQPAEPEYGDHRPIPALSRHHFRARHQHGWQPGIHLSGSTSSRCRRSR